MPKINEFNLIKEQLNNYNLDGERDSIDSFYFLALGLIFGLSDPEIDESITDSKYLKVHGEKSGHDRGIDAVHIIESSKGSEIHLFNFKYSNIFEKLTNNFPSNEIDKVVSFISSVSEQDKNLLSEVNPILSAKIKQIWSIFANDSKATMKLHLCSNGYEKMEVNENRRLIRALKEFDVSIEYHLMEDFIRLINIDAHEPVNAKIKVVGKNYFEKTDGNVKALIAEFEARDLVRLIVDDEEMRNEPNLDNYSDVANFDINDSCFKDNVRVYLKQRSKINKNIKTTLLSEENSKVFYFNNGITLTCTKYKHPGINRNAPIIEITNLQIVNGCQTMNALYEAFKEKPEAFDDVTILCKVYEISEEDTELSTRISEYTNSQNPVKSRDIRSIDNVQSILEKQLEPRGYFYERKKNQHMGKENAKRIDAEVLGQVLCAFFNDMPVEAKNKKASIFGDNYEAIFNESLNADNVLLAWKLFEKIEQSKKEKRENLSSIESETDKEFSSYILYASMYILFMMHHLSKLQEIEISLSNFDKIWALYPQACSEIEQIIRTDMIDRGEKGITPKNFFKSNQLKAKFYDAKDIEFEKAS